MKRAGRKHLSPELINSPGAPVVHVEESVK